MSRNWLEGTRDRQDASTHLPSSLILGCLAQPPVCSFKDRGRQHLSRSGQLEPLFQGPTLLPIWALSPRGYSHPPSQPTPDIPAAAPSRQSLCFCFIRTSIPPTLVRGDTGLPCWGAPLAAGSPSTYPARLLTGRRSTCFLMTLSPVEDKQDSVTGEGYTARLGTAETSGACGAAAARSTA